MPTPPVTIPTTNYGFLKITAGTGKDSWAVPYNDTMDLIDAKVKDRENQANNNLPKAGGVLTGKVTFVAAAEGAASFNIPAMAAVPSPAANGDFWTTNTALFGRLNGITYQFATTQNLAAKADLASPDFTGIPLADTAAPGTNTRQIATTAFVRAATATPAFELKTANYTLLPADIGKVIGMNMGGANNWVIPNSSAIPDDSEFHGTQYGAGQTTIVASGVTVLVRGGLKSAGRYAGWTAKKISSAEWIVWGDLIA